MEQKISASIDHFYLAEGILAREITRMKRVDWGQRWYKPDKSTALINGASLSGTYENPDDHTVAGYTGYVQDVANFWATGQTRLDNHTDLFLRVTYPQGREDATSRGFFCRLIFPGPTQLRPTTPVYRRFEQRLDFDPSSVAERDLVLADVNQAERLREHNRPRTNVLVREIQYLVSRGVTIQQIAVATEQVRKPVHAWSFLATPAMAGEIHGSK